MVPKKKKKKVTKERYLAPDAAEYLGVTEAHIRRLCIQGKLPGKKRYLGKRYTWEISKDALDEYDSGLAPQGRPRGPAIEVTTYYQRQKESEIADEKGKGTG